MITVIPFTKMVAAGNDFILVGDARIARRPAAFLKRLARRMCDRTYGVGADGMLLLGPSGRADCRMRVFNADGSEAEMCGNGARCVAYYRKLKVKSKKEKSKKGKGGKQKVTLETKAGVITAYVEGDTVKLRLGVPKHLEFGIPLVVNSRLVNVDHIDTGVPHVVIFVSGIEDIEVEAIAPEVRFHKRFAPRGANVNFVEVAGKNAIRIRTYERGVEAETLACGTGSVAAALIYALKSGCESPVKVYTKSSELLKVYWGRGKDPFSEVWLEGKAQLVYRGEYDHV